METTRQLAQRILDTHHALLKRELPRLGGVLQKGDPELSRVFRELWQTMEEHLWKEEAILFPAIFALSDGEQAMGCGVMGPIRQMGYEHDIIRELETRLRKLAPRAGAEQSALIALLDDLAVHAQTEDDQLFPQALSLEENAFSR